MARDRRVGYLREVRQRVARPAGAVRITDLGYFSLTVFAALATRGVHFLSRLQYRTGVRTAAAHLGASQQVSSQCTDAAAWLLERSPGVG